MNKTPRTQAPTEQGRLPEAQRLEDAIVELTRRKERLVAPVRAMLDEANARLTKVRAFTSALNKAEAHLDAAADVAALGRLFDQAAEIAHVALVLVGHDVENETWRSMAARIDKLAESAAWTQRERAETEATVY